MHFLQNCLNPMAVLMLFVAASCLFGWGFPGYRERANYFWILWLIIGILAIVAWVILVLA